MKINVAELELLVSLMEECGEIIQATSKLLKFNDVVLENNSVKYNNLDDLHRELGDLFGIVNLLKDSDVEILDYDLILTYAKQKQKKYLNNANGRLLILDGVNFY